MESRMANGIVKETANPNRRSTCTAVAILTVVHFILLLLFGRRFAIVWFELPLLVPLLLLAKNRKIDPVLVFCFGKIVLFQAVEPAVAVPWIYWFALTPLYFVLERRRSIRELFIWGTWTGVLIATGCYVWLFHALSGFFEFGFLPAFGLYLLVSFLIGAHLSIFLPLARWLADHSSLPLWVVTPIVWAVVEFWMPLPFPLALSPLAWHQPIALQLIDVIGVSGVSLLVAAVSVAFALTIRGVLDRDWHRIVCALSAASGCLVLVFGYGAWAMHRYEPSGDSKPVRVALIQPVAPLKVLNKDIETKRRVAEELKRLSFESINANAPDLVVWPEGAGPFASKSPLFNPEYMTVVEEIQSRYDIPVLVQDIEFTRLPDSERLRYYSTATVVRTDGVVTDSYRKNILMPFSEYLPYEKHFPVLRKLLPEARSVLAGSEPVLLDTPGGPALPVICYEVLFPDYVRSGVNKGAGYIINLTNDRWYGERQQPHQHRIFSILRAIENRRPVVRCTNSGISCLIDARGVIAADQEAEIMAVTTLAGDVYPCEGYSFYGRRGDVLLRWILTPGLTVLALLSLTPWWKRLRRLSP